MNGQHSDQQQVAGGMPGDQQQFQGHGGAGSANGAGGFNMGQQNAPLANMMGGANGAPGQGMMPPQHPGMYQQAANGAGNGNGNAANQQLLQMGYMHDGPGQFMMPHGQAGGGQLPAGDPGVPHMVGALGDNGQGQIQNMGGGGQQPYGGGDYGNDDGSDENDGGGKGKRRSKNDVEGRDFKCSYCPKTYLSYPALYTHIKQKHSKGPDGEVRAPPTSGRGRGRPRKNPYHRTDPQKEAYFQQDDKKGGPTDPLLWFHDHYETILKEGYPSIEEYPLYKFLKQFSPSTTGNAEEKEQNETSPAKAPVEPKKQKKQAAKAEEEEDQEEAKDDKEDSEDEEDDSKEEDAKPAVVVDWQQQGWDRNYLGLTEQEKLSMYVDETFALYLYTVSQKVNDTFYRTVLAFVIFFRECLNEIGWKKRRESDQETKPEELDQLEESPFCLINTAEHAPEICNEFVTIYMEKNKSKFEIIKCEQIDLTINMCHWLFENQYTCSKLTMIT